MYEQQKTYDDAKRLVASPAGIEFEKYAFKFVTPAYFGARPQPGTLAKVNSGSASLVRLNGRSFDLTCWHVIDGYRQRLPEWSREALFLPALQMLLPPASISFP